MGGNNKQCGPNDDPSLRRRSVLAGLATTVGVFAGCTGVTSREFEATAVRLPRADQLELELAETAFDSDTTTREPGVGGIEAEVTITSHAATYQRGPAHGTPTVTEAFLSGVNGTLGSGAAVVVSGNALGIGDLALPLFEEELSIAGDRWSLVVPEGARTGGEVSLSKTILLVPGTAFSRPQWELRPQWSSRSQWVSGPEWIPGDSFVPGSRWRPEARWVPSDDWIPDEPESLRVLMATHDRESDVVFDLIGAEYDDLPGRPLEEREPFETENTMLAVPGPDWIPGERPRDATTVFDAGVPAPLRGGTYGLGVLSTPDAEVMRRSVNPVARAGAEELLTSDQVRRMFLAADITDADEVEWLRGPERIRHPDWETVSPVTLLGSAVDPATFAGIVTGEEGPWEVVVSLFRSVEEDVVVGVATQTSPVGSTGGSALARLDREEVNDAIATWLTGGAELSAASLEALRPADEAETNQNNYAEIEFTDQETDGTSVTVDRTYLEQDGFITIHTWDLIEQQDGPGTIVGVSRLLEAGADGEGKEYFDETVELFDPTTGVSEEFEGRELLTENQQLIAVPHRDMDRSGDFNFATEPHVDIPFTEGSQSRTDLPVGDAVNDVAYVSI